MQEVRAFLVAVMRRLGRDKTTDLWFHRKRRSSSSDSHSRISIGREPRYDIFTCEVTKYYTDHAPEDLQEVLYLADRYFRDPEETWSTIEATYGFPRPDKSDCLLYPAFVFE